MLTRCLKRILLSTGLLTVTGLWGCNGHHSAVVDGPYDTPPPGYTVSEPLESQQKLVPRTAEPRPLWNRLGAQLRDVFDRTRGWSPNIRRSAAFYRRPVTSRSALPSATRTKSVTFPMTDSRVSRDSKTHLSKPLPPISPLRPPGLLSAAPGPLAESPFGHTHGALKNVNPTGPKLFTP